MTRLVDKIRPVSTEEFPHLTASSRCPFCGQNKPTTLALCGECYPLHWSRHPSEQQVEVLRSKERLAEQEFWAGSQRARAEQSGDGDFSTASTIENSHDDYLPPSGRLPDGVMKIFVILFLALSAIYTSSRLAFWLLDWLSAADYTVAPRFPCFLHPCTGASYRSAIGELRTLAALGRLAFSGGVLTTVFGFARMMEGRESRKLVALILLWFALARLFWLPEMSGEYPTMLPVF